MDDLIKRINELAHKAKTVGLTDDETIERNELRQKYIKSFKENLRGVLDNVDITSDIVIHKNKIKDLEKLELLNDNEFIVTVENLEDEIKITYKDQYVTEKEIRDIILC